jgi:hypothetical protein
MTTRPSAEHDRLITSLAGDWSAVERIFPAPWDPFEGPRRGRTRARPGLGGLFLISDYTQDQDGVEVFAGHGVYGWNGECYTMQWFDSTAPRGGDVVPGVWDDATRTLSFHRAGATTQARFIYTIRGPDEYLFQLLFAHGGTDWQVHIEGQNRRDGG